ncbi:XRE family transcriptional regulator [Geoglobus acetivorans]|uniref:XRE family transcriptional regulator n=1 Tax=Geoglobus acetivorans TaxID=565033 RepID=A0ABZ3H5D6_GEOAI
MKTPCELYASKIVPAIRGELARELVGRGHKKKDVAKMLGITVAAVSQYVHRNRGVAENEYIKSKIKEIADAIEEGTMTEEEKSSLLCEICSIFRREVDVKQI